MRQEQLYALRFWRDGKRGGDWRASLKNVHTQEIRNFAELVDLETHLRQLLDRLRTENSQPGHDSG